MLNHIRPIAWRLLRSLLPGRARLPAVGANLHQEPGPQQRDTPRVELLCAPHGMVVVR
ncbi:hypothetical protein [Streptomyces botrytidirepellens]|uniref:hypothetical protein n=1 Tax=Streptomyces botrytidirepellens TaxID=2486417 RepID=UPI0016197B64|nr:hypothetical protein [Streptomyces botrytidirepellens]